MIGVAVEALPERVKATSVLLLNAVVDTGVTTGVEAGEENTEALETERPAALLEL